MFNNLSRFILPPGISLSTLLTLGCGVLLCLGGVVAGYQFEHQKLLKREGELAQQLSQADQKYREMEHTHAIQVQNLTDEFERKNADARERDAVTIAALRGGNQRLRLQVSACTGSPASAPSTQGVDAARTAELAPETAAALYSIAGDGDRAIRKLTALQAYVLTTLSLCGAKP